MQHTIQVTDRMIDAARAMKCPCKGSGSLVMFHKGKASWVDCPVCGTDRQNVAYGPATIKMHAAGQTSQGHVFELSDFPENALMAHVMAKAGIFPSIGQARKNGWDKPIEVGVWTVTKQKIRIEVNE